MSYNLERREYLAIDHNKCSVAARVEGGELRSGGDRRLQYLWLLFTLRIVGAGLRGREKAGQGPCPRPSKREGISFLILA